MQPHCGFGEGRSEGMQLGMRGRHWFRLVSLLRPPFDRRLEAVRCAFR